jgi:N-acetylglucosamine kinase-like BadF-type ATPase
MPTDFVIGIDGGGTHTRAVVVASNGQVLGLGTAGPGNYHNIGEQAAAQNIAEAVHQAQHQAGVERRPARAAFFGLGSIVTEQDRQLIHRISHSLQLAPQATTGVDHDMPAALAGGLAGAPGMVLIMGTGSGCFGRDPAGQSWRAGGWGPRLDDLGGGYWLGLQAMIAAVRAHDGRGEATVLLPRVMDVLGLTDLQQIMHKADHDTLTRREVGRLAHEVTAAAEQGEPVATHLIATGTEELARMIAAVAQRLNFTHTPVPVATAGGLRQAGAVIMNPLRQAMAQRAPHCELVEPKLDPVLGAAMLALERAGIDITDGLVHRLRHSWDGGQAATP